MGKSVDDIQVKTSKFRRASKNTKFAHFLGLQNIAYEIVCKNTQKSLKIGMNRVPNQSVNLEKLNSHFFFP